MNMRTPKCLLEKDPITAGLPHLDISMDFSEYEWMGEEELEDFDRQVEEDLEEEAFIEACFEEMFAEEEAQWHHFNAQQLQHPGEVQVTMETSCYSSEPCVSDQRLVQTSWSKLNPEAPEFIPRGLAS